MAKSFARGYVSSKAVETTTEEMQNIIPDSPPEWSYPYKLKKVSFFNHGACTIIINDTFEITLAAERGFESNYDDVPVEKLVIKEVGTSYEMIGSY